MALGFYGSLSENFILLCWYSSRTKLIITLKFAWTAAEFYVYVTFNAPVNVFNSILTLRLLNLIYFGHCPQYDYDEIHHAQRNNNNNHSQFPSDCSRPCHHPLNYLPSDNNDVVDYERRLQWKPISHQCFH